MNKHIPAHRTGITGLGTSLPLHKLEQNDVFERIRQSRSSDVDLMRWARRIFKHCGVDTRYTCEPRLMDTTDACSYLPVHDDEPVTSTAERMEVYERESVPLAVEAAREAMADARLSPSSITHLVTVSCTGQFLPGLDTLLTKELGLSPRITRTPLTFQGCSAGLKAVQLAQSIVQGNRNHTVLVVCVELCTIHFQPPVSRDALYAASFFGDGAAACIVSSVSQGQKHVFELEEGHSVLFPDSREEMIWRVGNHGFDLYLSPSIPKLLKAFLGEEVGRLTEGRAQPSLWAVHPGGRGIVDAVQDLFELQDEQVQFSRSILQHYGNLSSATILFVLKKMREELIQKGTEQENGIALAFGPGLSAELTNFTYVRSAEVIPEPESYNRLLKHPYTPGLEGTYV